MPPRRFFLTLFLSCAALTPALAELTEAKADDLYDLRHWEEQSGNAGSMKAGESTKLLVSPDGHPKAEYFHDGCDAAIHEFRLYHKRNGKWSPPTTSGADYDTHKFFTRYARVAAIAITNEAIELTVEDRDNGITFTEPLPFAAETYRSDYRVTIERRHLPLHEAALRGNAVHIRALPDGGKVNPRLPDLDKREQMQEEHP